MSNEVIIQSYVWHKGDCFFVSTINRASSAAMAYGRIYAETVVWVFDSEERKCGEFFGPVGEDGKGGTLVHFNICKKFMEFGRDAIEELEC